MRRKRLVSLAVMMVMALGLSATATLGTAGSPAVHQVRGHGMLQYATGAPDGGNSFDQISINAWMNADGTVDGMAEFTWQRHLLPGGGGKLSSGYPWTIAIDTMIFFSADFVYVEGVVIHSGQNPGDVGMRAGFPIVDNGNGADDPPDELNFTPLFAGNLTVR